MDISPDIFHVSVIKMPNPLREIYNDLNHC